LPPAAQPAFDDAARTTAAIPATTPAGRRRPRFAVTLSDGAVMLADHVVCATEGSLARALVRDPQREEREMLDAVCYNALGVVHYGFAQPLPPLMQ
ncbi:protoporphyrinogen oxidase, partial [bacterium M00.F.Ca.ET.199.01.1.1]